VDQSDKNRSIKGLTGQVRDIKVAIPAAQTIAPLDSQTTPTDIDLKRMAEWALHYLINTPRPEYNYEPVFQCYPLRCPPVPDRHDVVVPCDTDARMDWEWYFMRDITGSKAGKAVETAFHARMRAYIAEDGRVLAHPGCYNEGDIDHVYTDDDRVYHIWGATKILKSLSEDYSRTRNEESRILARKVMLALRAVTVSDDQGHCWLPAGMGALHLDGSVIPGGWNCHPAPIVEPLVTYYLACSDQDALQFAQAYADGIIAGCQPDGLHFAADGSFEGHSHATLHAVWGVAHLGVVLGESKYVDFAKHVFDWILTRGTGTGWFPAGPDDCNETCCISDMISIATLLGQAGYTEYFDYAERYFRNYIHPLQFIVTPEFETYYRSLHTDKDPKLVARGLQELRKFQGGIIGASGVNAVENELLHAHGFCMFGCCAPEGMRAIHTVWSNVVYRAPASASHPAGVYVNMSFARESKWAKVISFMPQQGRLTVQVKTADSFFLRPPHWVAKDEVRASVNSQPVPVQWSGDYIHFVADPGDELTITYPLIEFTHTVAGIWPHAAPDLSVTFSWRGNMVTGVDPPAEHTPLFARAPRVLPPAPLE
jgi:hypothetical protein